ncbi:butyrate kinase [Collinsella sp. zg1085]|uniref:butyrate kinase n=1 Tax=Collinsella sp. zg1085 TaxID=2844380 RepID=UPI001C0C6EFC|nr:butyrate kinase [Collinsella sp. zg1085]QWT17179.1 butyrate kinase [Collinsella sp. zg1085]
MTHTILTLSPGSTSTKVAVFRDSEAVFRCNITHPADELAAFDFAVDQFDYRYQTILTTLEAQGVALEDIDAFSGYCGAMGPTVGGIFAIDQKVCNHVMNSGVNHPAVLGAPLLFALAQLHGKPAYAVNQPDTDELADVARITGYPGVYRKSHVHCLNQKECALRAAQAQGKSYAQANIIVAHVGGGLSVAAHEQGRMVDANDVLEGSGPFAPNRSGDVPAKPLIDMAFAGKLSKQDMSAVVGKRGGLLGLTGTDDTRELIARIEAGDSWAKLVYEAMAYQVAKAIGGFAAVLKGQVDAIVLTGGVSHDPGFVAYVRERVGWIAPLEVYAGDFEMDALASGAIRALEGEEAVMQFSGEPSWDGFDMPGAFAAC